MKVGIVQPYFFPFLNYYKLLYAVDTIVIYDDVNFIKRGYINRNAILINGERHTFTIPCKTISQNKSINEISVNINDIWLKKFLKTLKMAYSRAPYFDIICPLIEKLIVNNKDKMISEISMESLKLVFDYLSINKKWILSSENHSQTKGMEKSDRLIEITKLENSKHYINSIGGLKLYNKSYFQEHGIKLNFLECGSVEYAQFRNEFVPHLSIIDVLMFNDKNEINNFLNEFKFI